MAGRCLSFACLFLLGCAGGGVPLDEVTAAPLALVYWDEVAARERAEAMDNLRDGKRGSVRRGVASVESVAEYINPSERMRRGQKIKDLPGRIALLNARTLELSPFPFAPANSRPLAWSRNHRKLLFSSGHLDRGRTQLFEYDLDSDQVSKLTRGPRYHFEGDYATDGRIVASWLDVTRAQRKTGMDILSATGSLDAEFVTSDNPMSPKWLREQDRIIYVRANRGGRAAPDSFGIMVRDAVPAAQTRPLSRGREPVLTPDGEWIVYTRLTQEGWRLQRMRADGSARSSLGDGSLDARWPAVSPDGRHVAYISNEDGIDRLYLRRMDGSGDRILLPTGGAAFPVW